MAASHYSSQSNPVPDLDETALIVSQVIEKQSKDPLDVMYDSKGSQGQASSGGTPERNAPPREATDRPARVPEIGSKDNRSEQQNFQPHFSRAQVRNPGLQSGLEEQGLCGQRGPGLGREPDTVFRSKILYFAQLGSLLLQERERRAGVGASARSRTG